MIASPWSLLKDEEQLILAPKLIGLHEELAATDQLADQLIEAAADQFNQFVIEYLPSGEPNHQAVQENILTAQNFLAQTGGRFNSQLWQQVAEIKGVRRSYLELTVRNRHEFLDELRQSEFVINREPFWSIHKFDSARAITDYSHQPSLHFANDRADERDYGPNYFFVHWDKTSCWFRKSNWLAKRWPGVRLAEQLYAAAQHRFGCACPLEVSEYLRAKSVDHRS